MRCDVLCCDVDDRLRGRLNEVFVGDLPREPAFHYIAQVEPQTLAPHNPFSTFELNLCVLSCV